MAIMPGSMSMHGFISSPPIPPIFAQELAATPLERFEPVDTPANRRLIDQDQEEECLLAYRTQAEYWGKERAVIVTYNPASARKQAYTFDDKLEAIRQQLLSMRAKLRDRLAHWREPRTIRERYLRLCERMHMPSELYDLLFEQTRDGYSMTFRKNVTWWGASSPCSARISLLRTIRIGPTSDIIQASLDRWQVEDRFRLSQGR